MGENHRRAESRLETRRRDANAYVAGRSAQLAEERRIASENELKAGEALLGTDEQVSGQLGGPSAELLPYLGRYRFDPAAGRLQISQGREIKTSFLQARTNVANELMSRAEAAARAGDFAEASRLKDVAKQSLTAGKEYKKLLAAEGLKGHKDFAAIGAGNAQVRKDRFGQIADTAGIESIFELVEDPAVAARARLGTPQALIVGKQVQEARAFQDFNSEASINERRLLSEPAERSLAAQQRTTVRNARNQALGAGGTNSAYGRKLASEASERAYGADRAQLFSTVAQQFQSMQRTYATNTVEFARGFLQNQAGIRDNFQGALDQIRANFSAISQQNAQLNQQMAISNSQSALGTAQLQSQERAQNMSMAMSVLGILFGAMTGGVGGAAMAAAGTAANRGAGS